MIARTIALAGIFGLLVLQTIWHGVIAPPQSGSAWLYVAFLCLPLLPSLVLLASGHRSVFLVGALAALLYFCDGVMVAMSEPPQRTLALVEIAISVIVVIAASWNGLRSRFKRKAAV